MKNLLVLTMFLATVSFGAFAGGPDEPVATAAEMETVTLTLAELKASYGVDNIEFDGVLAEDATVTIQKQMYPCGDPNYFPCDGALALAKQQLQQEANACCCNIVYGIECCDPSTGSLKAILFIVTPNSPSCN